MFYTTLALSLIWLLTLIKLSLTLSDKKRLKKSLSELYKGFGKELIKFRNEIGELKYLNSQLNTKLRIASEAKETAELELRDVIHKQLELMFTQSYRCSTCGQIIKSGLAQWDFKNMKPYCHKHVPPYDVEETEPDKGHMDSLINSVLDRLAMPGPLSYPNKAQAGPREEK